MTRRAQPEAAIQVKVMRAFAERGRRDAVMFAVPNGGSRGALERIHLANQGVVAGVPDLCVVMDGRVNFLELKAEHGTLDVRQRVMHRKLSEAGATVETAWGLDNAIATLERWGALRPLGASIPGNAETASNRQGWSA